jgi:hypothetical protein
LACCVISLRHVRQYFVHFEPTHRVQAALCAMSFAGRTLLFADGSPKKYLKRALYFGKFVTLKSRNKGKPCLGERHSLRSVVSPVLRHFKPFNTKDFSQCHGHL